MRDNDARGDGAGAGVPVGRSEHADRRDGQRELRVGRREPLVPPAGFGWYKRRKTSHFDAYNSIARDFAMQFDMDPWLITTLFHKCGVVNFKEKKGIDCVARNVDKVIAQIKAKTFFGNSQKCKS